MKRVLQHILVMCIAFSFCSNAAYAAVISTEAALAVQQRADSIARVSGIMLREDVSAALVQMGVDPAKAVERVEALTLHELAELENQLATLPAGGIGVVEVVGVVAVVLIVLELLGVTNVFTKL
ncbi:MAG: PA2779 family protein [Gammaproteobacteria bacterium]|nr:PA2779 family protein [Gammaproteobacteria bacterium]